MSKTFWDLHKHDELCEVTYCGVGRPPTPWCERFASKIHYVVDCWLWDAALLKKDSERNRLTFSLRCGDLTDKVSNYQTDACRWIYERVVGPIPESLELDHWYCEDWRCVHPHHVEPVTNLENNQRYRDTRASWTIRDELGRFAGRSDDGPILKFRDEDILEMISLHDSGFNYRQIGDIFDASPEFISMICRGLAYKHIERSEVVK